MSPTREGFEAYRSTIPLRNGERPTHCSIWGTSVVSCVDHRPIVIRNFTTSVSGQLLSLIGPGFTPEINEFVDGNLQGRLAFAIGRYDSSRELYSPPSQTAKVNLTSGTLAVQPVENVVNNTLGIPIGLDLVTPSLTVATAATQLGVRFEVPTNAVVNFVRRVNAIKVTLKMQNASPVLAGTVRIQLLQSNADDTASTTVLSESDTIDASTITTTYVQYAFNLQTPQVLQEGIGTVAWGIKVIWSAAATQTTNCLIWQGDFASVTKPTVTSPITISPTFEQIAQNAFEVTASYPNALGKAGQSTWLAAANFHARQKAIVQEGAYNPMTGIIDYPQFFTTPGWFGAYRNNDGNQPRRIEAPKVAVISAPVTTGVNSYGNTYYAASYSTITVNWTNPPSPASSVIGQTISFVNPGATPPNTFTFLYGTVTAANGTSVTISNWKWLIALGAIVPDFGKIGNYPSSSLPKDGPAQLQFRSVAGSRTDVRANDSITGAVPSTTRTAFYRTIGGVETQDAGPASYRIDFDQEITGYDDPTQTSSTIDFSAPDMQGKAGIKINNIADALGDEETDDYDNIVPWVFSASTGEWYTLDPLPTASLGTSITINNFDPTNARVAPPNNQFVFPAVGQIQTLRSQGEQRLVGAVMGGFDPFTDQPRLEYFTPTVALTTNGVLTASGSYNLSTYRDGEYIVIAYDGSNNELCRGFIHDSGTSNPGTGLNGASLNNQQIQICTDFERTEVLTSDQDAFGSYLTQRWEIRRQVVATATVNSNRLKLSYDAAGTVLAEVGNQAWTAQYATVSGISGIGDIVKPATYNGTYDGSLDDNKELGSELVLAQPWNTVTGAGLLVVGGRSKTVFFGRGGATEWEQTGDGYAYDIQSKYPIRAILAQGDEILVITEGTELYRISANAATIVDPVDLETAIQFDVRAFTSSQMYQHNFTCVSTATCPFPTNMVAWVGAEGIVAFDGVSVRLLMDGQMTSTWSGYDRDSMKLASFAVDQTHPYSPVIRVAGLSLEGESDTDRQLGLIIRQGAWLDFSGQRQNITCMAPIIMRDGSTRIVFGGDSRLWLYGVPWREGVVGSEGNILLFPYVGGTQYGTVTGVEDPDGNDALVDSTASFTAFGDGYIWEGTNIPVYKISDAGDVERAVITSWYNSTTLLVTPDSTWTFAVGTTYSYIIGGLQWEVELPYQTPMGAYDAVALEQFQFDYRTASNFQWQYELKVYGAPDNPDLSPTAIATVPYVAADLTPIWEQNTLCVGPDYRIKAVITGYCPPDYGMTLFSFQMRLRYTVA